MRTWGCPSLDVRVLGSICILSVFIGLSVYITFSLYTCLSKDIGLVFIANILKCHFIFYIAFEILKIVLYRLFSIYKMVGSRKLS